MMSSKQNTDGCNAFCKRGIIDGNGTNFKLTTRFMGSTKDVQIRKQVCCIQSKYMLKKAYRV